MNMINRSEQTHAAVYTYIHAVKIEYKTYVKPHTHTHTRK